MKHLSLGLIAMIAFVGLVAMKNPPKKEIKVQIMHHNQVVIDTILSVDEKDAGPIIEDFINQFSKDPIAIDTRTVHGLYVFNITNEQWVGKNTKKTDNSYSESGQPTTWVLNVDSLFNEVSGEIKKTWEKASVQVYIDSLGEAIDQFDFNRFKKKIDDVSIEGFNQDIKDFWGKI